MKRSNRAPSVSDFHSSYPGGILSGLTFIQGLAHLMAKAKCGDCRGWGYVQGTRPPKACGTCGGSGLKKPNGR